MAKVAVQPNGCWIWTASRMGGGPRTVPASDGGLPYGQFYLDGTTHPAHRAAWMLFVGPIPAGLHIDHYKCRNTLCVNPEHLDPVTNKENSRRGKGSVANCKHGHPYDDENTGWKHDKKRGWRRYCRACARGPHGQPRHDRRRKDRSDLTRAWPNC
jgi:HNH endonuclease